MARSAWAARPSQNHIRILQWSGGELLKRQFGVQEELRQGTHNLRGWKTKEEGLLGTAHSYPASHSPTSPRHAAKSPRGAKKQVTPKQPLGLLGNRPLLSQNLPLLLLVTFHCILTSKSLQGLGRGLKKPGQSWGEPEEARRGWSRQPSVFRSHREPGVARVLEGSAEAWRLRLAQPCSLLPDVQQGGHWQ